MKEIIFMIEFEQTFMFHFVQYPTFTVTQQNKKLIVIYFACFFSSNLES